MGTVTCKGELSCTGIHALSNGESGPEGTNCVMIFPTRALYPPSTAPSATDLLLELHSFWIFQGLHEGTDADSYRKLPSEPTGSGGVRGLGKHGREEGLWGQHLLILSHRNSPDTSPWGDYYYIPFRVKKTDASPNIFPVSLKLYYLPRYPR